MQLIDTHAHLYLETFSADREAVLQRARDNGVQKIFLPNIDGGSIAGMLALEIACPDLCHAMMGLHPCSVDGEVDKALDTVHSWLQRRKFAAVGEIGLDYHWDITWKEQQLLAFRRQADWALEYDLPIVIHSRNATADCIAVLKEKQNGKLRGIFHCFSGTAEEAQQITDLGFLLGIGGVVTFKNAGLDKVVQQLDLRHLVLETDAPYLAPVPYRGKRNESSYLTLIAGKIAALKGTTLEEVAGSTTAQALRLFGYDF
ncbi:TatD family hydrolase [Compostibacter hankyongensis]|uniref:TatD family hydrolase n=1 Tax=Compostibacter hankyongensis TaxID=1007089 RepID=A0ABP8FUE6_9BACT